MAVCLRTRFSGIKLHVCEQSASEMSKERNVFPSSKWIDHIVKWSTFPEAAQKLHFLLRNPKFPCRVIKVLPLALSSLILSQHRHSSFTTTAIDPLLQPSMLHFPYIVPTYFLTFHCRGLP